MCWLGVWLRRIELSILGSERKKKGLEELGPTGDVVFAFGAGIAGVDLELELELGLGLGYARFMD